VPHFSSAWRACVRRRKRRHLAAMKHLIFDTRTVTYPSLKPDLINMKFAPARTEEAAA